MLRDAAAALLRNAADIMHDEECPHSLCPGDCEDGDNDCEARGEACNCIRADLDKLREAVQQFDAATKGDGAISCT